MLAVNQPGQMTYASPEGLPSVAVVILNYNGRAYLEKFLPSVMASTYPNMHVVVADNDSSDDSVSFLSKYPRIRVIRLNKNFGFAKGYNEALKEVRADYYVLLNSDVEVCPGWIEPVLELMKTNTDIAACQPKILSYHQKQQFEYAGACGGWIDRYGYPFSRGRVFEHIEEDKGQYEDPGPCFWASGAAMFIRAEKFHALGGFDEHFFAHQEEIDLCWRLQLTGSLVYVQPGSVVYHVGGGTLPRGNSLKTFLNFRNNLWMLYKNLPWPAMFWLIPFRMGLDALAAWKALLGGDPGYFTAVARAHIHALLGLRKLSRSKPVSPGRKLKGWYNGSVVWDYFIRKRREFSQIVLHK